MDFTDILAFLDANPFYKYAILFLVILPLIRKFWKYCIDSLLKYKK